VFSITSSVIRRKNHKLHFYNWRIKINVEYDASSWLTLLECLLGQSGAGQFFCQLPVGCQIADNHSDTQKDK
jgi:hypothetical protein